MGKASTSQKRYSLVIIVVLSALACTETFGSSSGSPQYTYTAFYGNLLPFLIAYLFRRRPIGGWLLFFYIQLYLNLIFTLLLFPSLFSELRPADWSSFFDYGMFFLSVVPPAIILILESCIATVLLFRRNERNVRLLRSTLLGLVIASMISIIVDAVYFKEHSAISISIVAAIYALVWYLYFTNSRRVQMVFIDKTWNYLYS